MASHDFGRTFLPPQKVNDDHLWWYTAGGAIAPNGDAYFALDGESSLTGHGHDFDGPVEIALLRCSPSASASCGNPTLTSFASPPPHRSAPCPPAIPTTSPRPRRSPSTRPATRCSRPRSATRGTARKLYAETSNGGAWSSRVLVNDGGDRSFPAIDVGSTAGDVRLAWQDNRTGAYNTWYARSTNGGSTWGSQVRLSNLTSDGPYKSAAGYEFTDGDYFGLAVGSTGVAHEIWGEADGSSLHCCGDVWYTKGS